MTRAYHTNKARADIYERGKEVKRQNKKGVEVTVVDKTKPANSKDKVMIKKGESYWWWKFAFGSKIYSLTKPKRSQLTRSEFLAWLYDLEDEISEATVSDGDELESLRDGWIDAINSMKDDLEERLSNMPEQLQEVGSGAILTERIEALESWADELEDVDCSVETVEPSDVYEENEKEEGEEQADYEIRIEALVNEKNDEAVQDVLAELQNVSSNL